MEVVIDLFLGILGVYFLIGLLVGIYFLIKASRIDPLMANSKKGVRFLLFPGIIATWPFFIKRVIKAKPVSS